MARPKKKKEKKFILTIKLGDITLRGEGNDALEALKAIPPPVKIFTKGIIYLTDGEKSVERMWLPFKVKRLFFPLSQPLLSKQLTYLMR